MNRYEDNRKYARAWIYSVIALTIIFVLVYYVMCGCEKYLNFDFNYYVPENNYVTIKGIPKPFLNF